MKSHLLHTFQFAIGKIGVVSLLSVLALFASIPALAQDSTWKVDGDHSFARLSAGATELGIARVTGNVVFDVKNPADPAVSLTIDPEQSAQYSTITFRSKRSAMTDDGKLAVVGDLSLTRVERSVNMDANESYYGATYGEPVSRTQTREVSLLFPVEAPPALQSATMQLSASTNVSREYFPELVSALEPGSWSNMVVEDEQCTVPTAVGEGYYGPVCTGTPVATATNSVPPATPAGGEGYYGFESASAPTLSSATIALDLRLSRVSAPSASLAANNAGN